MRTLIVVVLRKRRRDLTHLLSAEQSDGQSQSWKCGLGDGRVSDVAGQPDQRGRAHQRHQSVAGSQDPVDKAADLRIGEPARERRHRHMFGDFRPVPFAAVLDDLD